jgi:GAF domain-containing protein
MEGGPDLATALARAARTIDRKQSLEDSLDAIVRTAQASVPGFNHVGISIIDRHDHIHTRAATDPLVWELDRLQYDLGEGPCVSAMREVPVVTVPHAASDPRWPRYMPAAVRAGLKSQLAVRLFLDDEGTMGGLNLYSTTSETLDPGAEGIADLFAAHAAIALGRAREIANLNDALHSRKLIGQAIGIIMERYDIDDDRAFAFLVRASSHSNVKLRDVAQDVVAKANAHTRRRPPCS